MCMNNFLPCVIAELKQKSSDPDEDMDCEMCVEW